MHCFVSEFAMAERSGGGVAEVSFHAIAPGQAGPAKQSDYALEKPQTFIKLLVDSPGPGQQGFFLYNELSFEVKHLEGVGWDTEVGWERVWWSTIIGARARLG